MWTRWGFAAAVAVAGAVTAATACTGDDPDLGAGTEDAGGGTDATIDQGAPADTGVPGDAGDAGPKCHPDDPFGPGTLLDGVNDGQYVVHPRLTLDEREIFYQHVNDIYRAFRGDRALPFGPGSEIATSDAAALAQDPSISGDTLALYVALNTRIARQSRAARTAPFGTPVFLPFDTDASLRDQDPHVLADESALYFAREEVDAGNRIWRAPGVGDGGFLAPVRIELGLDAYTNPSVSEDELVLYVFHQATNTMRRSIRPSDASAFPTPAPVDEINAQALGGGSARPGWISPDGCRMYFASGTAESKIYLAERTPR